MNNLFDVMRKEEFEQVVYGYDKHSGMQAIIAIHNTALGPAFGGTRMMTYNSFDEALNDCLKLAKAMTFKNAAGGIDFGGGKAVIIGDPKRDKTESLLRAFGRLVNSLAGRYITGVDVGTDEEDMILVRRETKYNVALPESYGGGGSTSAATAYGLYHGMKAAAEILLNVPSLENIKVSIQGVGNIGYELARYLVKEKAKVIVTDVDRGALKNISDELGVTVVEPDAIYSQEVDIFAPCALGGILNNRTIPQLKCKVIAGSANNQLLDEKEHSKMLLERDIFYGVDYILSVGGCINNTHQFLGYNRERAYGEVKGNIQRNIRHICRESAKRGISPLQVAQEIADHRLEMAVKRKSWYMEGQK
jgi:leucine dehydrogenase